MADSSERQIDAISIGIGANVAGLKQSLQEAQALVSGFSFRAPKQAEIPFTVKINTGAAEQKINRFMENNAGRNISVNVQLRPTTASMADFRKLMREKIAQGNDFTIPFKADFKSAQNIKASLQAAVDKAGPVVVQVAWQWGEGGPPPSGPQGGGGGPAPRPSGSRPSRGGGGTAAPPSPPAGPATPSVITRQARPARARAGGAVALPPVAPPTGGYHGNLGRSATEFQPGVGAARGQGIPPGMAQRLKNAIAHTMRTGDPSDIYSILGPFQAMTGTLGKYADYNLPGLNGEQVNLAQLIDQAMGFATNYGQRKGANQPLREFEEYTPRNVKFNPNTVELGERAISADLAFARRARGRVDETGAFRPIDIRIAEQRRRVLNNIQTQLHAEDPKTFLNAFSRRGSVSRLQDFGLMSLAQLSGARASLKQIAPASPDVLETLAASERHNKQLVANTNAIANARKRALAPDREASTVQTKSGRNRGIPALGLPFVQGRGFSDVESFLKFLQEGEDEANFQAKRREGFSMGGHMRYGMGGSIGNVGYANGGELGPLQRRILEKQGKLLEKATESISIPTETVFEPEWRRRARVGLGVGKDLTGRAGGGRTKWGKSGAYIVGEQGDEVFVPESAGWIIPHRLKDQLPKRADGGAEGTPRFPSGTVDPVTGQKVGGRFYRNDAVKVYITGIAPVTAAAGGPLKFGQLPPEVQAQYADQLGGNGTSAKVPALSLAESEQVRFATYESEDVTRREAVLRRANVTGQVAQAAARAFGPDIGQIVATQTGRAGIILRQRLAALAESDVKYADARIRVLRGQRLKAQVELGKTEDPEVIEKLRNQIESLSEAEAVAVDYQAKYTKGAEAASKNVATFGDKIKTLGGNLTGILAGTLVYGTLFQGIQKVLDAAVPALGDFVDASVGFRGKATAVTSALGEQTTALHGNADAAIANAAAVAGLDTQATAFLSSQLKLTTQVKAGAAAQQGASDLFRAAAGVGQGGAPQGLFGGYGGLLGSSFLAQSLGGGKGFSETIFGDLGSFLSKAPPSSRVNTPQGLITSRLSPGQLEQVGLGSQVPTQVLNEVGQQYLSSLNEQIQRGGGTAKFTFDTDPARRQQAANAARAAGDTYGASAALKGFIVTVNGAVASTKQYTDALEEAAIGASKPSAAVVAAGLALQRNITQGTIQAQTAYQQQVSLPQQAAVQFYGNRPLAPGVGVVPPAGAQGFGGFGAVDTAATAAFSRYKSIATNALDYVQNYAQQGFDSLKEAGVSGLDNYKAIGDQILSIQTDLANQVSVQSAVEYNHQLYIAKRNLTDAAALTGVRVANEQNNLGFLQRESFLLERQSTSLSLALSQRQINFQRAVAGFQAPGLTSEERAARIEEAKLEADYAQKQLNISKKQFTLGGQIFNVSAVRQLKDVQFALQDLQAGHRIEVNTKAAQQAIGALQQQLAIEGGQIGAQIAKNEAIFSAKISETATIAATATSTAFSEILKGVDAAWNAFAKGASAYNTYVQSLAGGGATTSQNKGNFKGGARAGGFLGTISGATQMTVGEAGAETVAVLRHPRSMAMTPSSGGAVQIIINNPTVRNDNDIQAIAAAVERAMQNRAKLTLPRVP